MLSPPPVISADLESGTGKSAPVPTSYCCGRCRSSSCCCGRCRVPCTPRLKAVSVTLVVLLCLACAAAVVLGVYFGTLKPTVPLRVTTLSGHRAQTGRRLHALSPAAAVASSTASAYAQVRLCPRTVNRLSAPRALPARWRRFWPAGAERAALSGSGLPLQSDYGSDKRADSLAEACRPGWQRLAAAKRVGSDRATDSLAG